MEFKHYENKTIININLKRIYSEIKEEIEDLGYEVISINPKISNSKCELIGIEVETRNLNIGGK